MKGHENLLLKQKVVKFDSIALQTFNFTILFIFTQRHEYWQVQSDS